MDRSADRRHESRSPRPAAPPWTAVLHDWVTTVDHKKIGIMYVLMAWSSWSSAASRRC